MIASSTPSVSEFNPKAVPYQFRVIRDLRASYDFSQGVHELLLSGSVGSAKSILAAHLAVSHCLFNERARVCLARKSMPDLKSTILAKVLEHMEGDLIEGEDYEHNETKGQITFSNGSEIVSRSWADKKYKKFRSLELSAAVVEELTENNDEDMQAYLELKMRIGRLPHVKENFLVAATNPDAPSHWAYKYFFESDSATRHVYKSVTTDNPFLPAWYIEQLQRDLDPKLARRMLRGEWLEITNEVIYHAYSSELHFRKTQYKLNPRLPIHICFDFNIGEGKPMSACLFQRDGGAFHFFMEVIIDGARTLDVLEELAGRGVFEHRNRFIIQGDATGSARDTRSKKSDYELIDSFMANFQRKDGSALEYQRQVPLSNPPVRTRHNTVNATFLNDLGQVSAYVYEACPELDKGFRLTALKKGGGYVEDDSKRFQHVTTAAGYGIVETLKRERRGASELHVVGGLNTSFKR